MAFMAIDPHSTVHAKTIYSAVQMLRRTPPGPVFAELGGFPPLPLMEDVELTKRLRRLGPPTFVPLPLRSSSS